MGGEDGEVFAMVCAADFLLAAGAVGGGFVSAGMADSAALPDSGNCRARRAGTGSRVDFPTCTLASRNLRNVRTYASHCLV